MINARLAKYGMAIASLVGLFASAYLYYTYVTGADIACAIVSGCDIIRASKWANSLGMPRPFWGLVFYTGFFGLLVVRAATPWRPKLLLRLTQLGVIVGFIESVILFLIQWIDLKAFCFWCLLSGIAATFIALFSLFDRHEEEWTGNALRHYLYFLLVFLPLATIAFAFLIM